MKDSITARGKDDAMISVYPDNKKKNFINFRAQSSYKVCIKIRER